MSLRSDEALVSQHQKNSLAQSTAARPSARKGSAGRWTRRMAPLAALLLACPAAWAQNGVFSPAQPVGTASAAPVKVTVTASATGTVASVEVLTAGVANLDFTAGSGTSTCMATPFPVAQGVTTCTESVTFTPSAPGVRLGAVVLLDSNGDVLGTAYLSGIGKGGLGVLAGTKEAGQVVQISGNILPFAGNGNYKNPVVDGIPATQSELFLPSSVAVDGAGNVYIADTNFNRIRMVCASATSSTIAGVTCPGAGDILTIAGTGTPSYSGDNGPAANADLNHPAGVTVDGAGKIYIADTGNNVVRMISPGNGWISTVAGNGTAGYTGDTTSATSINTELDAPQGIALDASGNLYIADTGNNVVRMVAAATGIITTVVGNGTAGYGGDGLAATSASVELDAPDAIAFDAQGDMYIADTLNDIVREVSASTGEISTFAGSPTLAGYAGDGGLATAATLNAPSGLAVDPAGNVYIADTQNNAIRKVSASTGDISTFAVNGTGEYYYTETVTPYEKLFAPVSISKPNGLALDSNADLFFADTFNLMVREIQSNYVALDLTATPVRIGTTSATYSQTVENDGNAPLTPLTLPSITIDPNGTGYDGDVNAELAAAPTTTCPENTNPFLAATDDDCVIGAIFAPSLDLTFATGVSSESVDSNIYVGATGNTANSPLDIEMVGIATPLNSTSVNLTSSQNPSYYTQSVTFKATVSTGTGTLTGKVIFYDGGVQIGTPVTVSSGSASYTTTTLSVGSHTITAVYQGDSPHYASIVTPQSTVTQVVNEFTTTTLTANPVSPSALGKSVTFTATVKDTYHGGVPLDNTVNFTDGTTSLCSNVALVLNAGTYTATCVAPALPQGQNPIVTTYSGDATNYILSSVSTTLNQEVQGTSALTLTAAPTSSTYGQQVTFSVTIPDVGTTPATGSVLLFNGATQIGTILLSGNPASGSVQIANLPVSTVALPDNISATYAGDVNYSSATAGPIAYVVNQASTTTTITASTTTADYGASVKLTAVVTPTQTVTPLTGNVTFTDTVNGGTPVTLACTPQPTVAASTCTLTTLPVGTNSIVATYAGDTNDAPSTSLTPAVVTVVQETISLTSNAPSYYGNPVQFTINIPTIGTVAATGKINILDGTKQIGSVTLTSADAGTMTFTTTAPLPVSTAAAPDVITASYVGNTNYPAISTTLNQVVNPAQTQTVVTADPNPGIAGAPVVLMATVTVTQGVSTPTGTVNFTDNGVNIGSETLDTNGNATLSKILAPGTNNIVATYGGDTDDATSNGSLALPVNQAATTTTVTPSANPSVVLVPVTFTTTVASVGGGIPGGTVTFTATPTGGTTVTALCNAVALTPGTSSATATCQTATLLVGSYTITATYSGDTDDVSSTGTLTSMVVEKIPTITGLASATTPAPNPELILVASVVNYAPTASDATSLPVPQGTVTFTLSPSGTVVGSAALDSTGVATFTPSSLPAGNFSFIATYSGDAQHAASTSVIASQINPAEGFNMTVTPSSVTVAATQNVTVSVNISSISGYADTIALGCASLPPGVNCHFTIPSGSTCSGSSTESCVTLPATSTSSNPVIVSLTIDTNNPLGGGESAMNTRPGSKGFALAGLFLPLSILFGCVFWRFRKRHPELVAMALVLLLSGAALAVSGCASGFSQSSAAPGTYTIEVTGTGISSNITHYQDVTLTITQ